MANAAAKKAAAARKATAATYKPILLCMNGLYVLLLAAAHWQQQEVITIQHMFGCCLLWTLQYVAYHGILQDAATGAGRTKTKMTKTTKTSSNSQSSSSLYGGTYLDLLVLTIVIQLTSVLWTPRVYWLLLVIPPSVLWNLL